MGNKMRKKNSKNNSGIQINDSIVLSLEKKQRNNRSLISCIIAASGLLALLMSFFSMFYLSFDTFSVMLAVLIFSVIDIFISVKKGKAFWLIPVILAIYGYIVYIKFDEIVAGFKFSYNTIYRMTNYTKSDYYIGLKAFDKYECITVFLIAAIFIIAFFIYFFTIVKPNPIPVVAVTFPIIEIGLYYGIEISIFWGCLLIAYWFAVLVIAFSDIGEYDGGRGGFMRKGNLFFPKRNMKFKVTEKCALGVMTGIMSIVLISLAVMKISGYERSDSINSKRAQIKQAINNFSIDDVIESVSGITDTLGLKLDYEDNRLGNQGSISYSNTKELKVTFSEEYDAPIYLKGFVASVYGENEWLEFNENVYKKNKELFDKFETYKIYPQEIYCNLNSENNRPVNVEIETLRKKRKTYVPYFATDYGNIIFEKDTLSKFKKTDKYNCKVMPYALSNNPESITNPINITLNYSKLNDDEYLSMIDKEAGDTLINIDSVSDRETLLSNNRLILAALIENEYRDFVYNNYLSYPDNKSFEEINKEYYDIINSDTSTAKGKFETLDKIREKIHSQTEYTLSPGKTPSNRDFVNYFLFESGEGYCVHYATAGIMLARMAGIPARYATGYIIVDEDFKSNSKNADGSYTITLKDNSSHAWAEVYIDGYGWVPFEFTAGYSEEKNNTQTTMPTTTTKRADNSQTRQSSSRQTGDKITKTSTVSRITQTTSVSGIIKHTTKTDKPNEKTISPLTKKVIIVILLMLLFVLFVYLRRRFIITYRKKKFRNNNTSKAISDIYSYTLKLLLLFDIKRRNEAYNVFAENVESELAGKYFNAGDFKRFMELVLKGAFSDETADKQEVEAVETFAKNLAETIYNNSNPFRKIYIKLVVVLK